MFTYTFYRAVQQRVRASVWQDEELSRVPFAVHSFIIWNCRFAQGRSQSTAKLKIYWKPRLILRSKTMLLRWMTNLLRSVKEDLGVMQISWVLAYKCQGGYSRKCLLWLSINSAIHYHILCGGRLIILTLRPKIREPICMSITPWINKTMLHCERISQYAGRDPLVSKVSCSISVARLFFLWHFPVRLNILYPPM